MKKLVAVALGLLFATCARGSSLSTAAAALQPGQWVSFSTVNVSLVMGQTEKCHTGSSRNGLGESGELRWDPNTRKVWWIGSDHNDEMYFASYTESDNTWRVEPRGAWFLTGNPADPAHPYNCGMNHGEDGVAFDPAAGMFYYKMMLPAGATDQGAHRYATGTGTWTDLPLRATAYYEDVEGADWFPEMNAYVIANGGGGRIQYQQLDVYSETTHAWTKIPQGVSYSGDTASQTTRGFVTYSPVHHSLLFTICNCSNNLFRLSASGVITKLRDSPINTGIMNPSGGSLGVSAINWADPVTGDYVFISNTTKDLWRYDMRTDSWAKLRNINAEAANVWSSYAAGPLFAVASGEINTYNVVMFLTCESSSTCRVNLFKYAPAAVPPAKATGVLIQ